MKFKSRKPSGFKHKEIYSFNRSMSKHESGRTVPNLANLAKVAVAILVIVAFLGSIGLLFKRDLTAEAVKFGIMKKKTDNFGTVLGKIGDYNVVQAGLAPDMFNIPVGNKYVYVYKSLDFIPVSTSMKPLLKYDLLIVNEGNKFKDASQIKLEYLGKNKTFSSKTSYRLQPEVLKNMKEMLGAAHAEGNKNIIVTGSYRGINEQTRMFTELYKYWSKRIKNPYEKTNEKVAKPGYSEHHTGMAADIVSNGATSKTFAKTKFYKWMHANSYKYGFVERYPKGKESVTKYMWESWHYRYVGLPYSKYLTKNGLVLEELLEKLQMEKSIVIEYAARRYNLIYLKGAENISVEPGVEYEIFKLTATEKILMILE